MPLAAFSEAVNGKPASAPRLDALLRCSSGPQPNAFSLTLDEAAIAYIGIDPKYLGANADVDSSLEFSVYLKPNQLAHR